VAFGGKEIVFYAGKIKVKGDTPMANVSPLSPLFAHSSTNLKFPHHTQDGIFLDLVHPVSGDGRASLSCFVLLGDGANSYTLLAAIEICSSFVGDDGGGDSDDGSDTEASAAPASAPLEKSASRSSIIETHVMGEPIIRVELLLHKKTDRALLGKERERRSLIALSICAHFHLSDEHSAFVEAKVSLLDQDDADLLQRHGVQVKGLVREGLLSL